MLSNIIASFIDNGTITTFVYIVGILRLTIKPLMELLRFIVKRTPTNKDQEIFEKIENSRVFKSILWVLEWVSSIDHKCLGGK